MFQFGREEGLLRALAILSQSNFSKFGRTVVQGWYLEEEGFGAFLGNSNIIKKN